MRKYFFAIIALLSLFIACQSNNTDQTANDTATPDTTIVPATMQYCYQYIKDKDTAQLTLMSSGPITTGELSYNLFEKDKNKGIFEGELYGDTLIAEYTFNSEGKESVRQIAFLKKGDQLLEGYGDVEEKGGKMIFKNKGSLKFGEGLVFSKVECH
jgi:hypothetical protein